MKLPAGKGAPLSAQGLTAALQAAGLRENDAALLWTIVEVETSGVTQGFGFRPDRLPQVLFERHKFSEFTNGAFDAAAPDLSGPRGKPYGSVSSQITRLEGALDLCEKAGWGPEPAYRATSWGLGQVMGFNYSSVGYASAAAMVDDMLASEDKQLLAMGRFLAKVGLSKPLRAHRWADFAAGYNGPAYSDYKYDVQLERQYERISSGSTPDLRIRAAQAALMLLGYPPGKIDGVLGDRTRRALRAFATDNGRPPPATLDDETEQLLKRQAGFD